MDGLNVSDNAGKIGQAFDYAFKAAQIFVGLKVTGFVSNMALSAKATVANMIAQQSLKMGLLLYLLPTYQQQGLQRNGRDGTAPTMRD